ncbi:MAG: HAMP domain-containing sensor histidine kinase [Actinomycetota bacterium]|nr:HAMP domain-containing sensor histidine kinase [Actinomycetota bacterium]
MKNKTRIPLSGLRIRLAFLYSILLFGLASLGVGVIYLSLSVSLSDEPMSRDAAFQILVDELGEFSSTPDDIDSVAGLTESNQTQLVGFEQAVNQRALDQLRSYSGWSLLALFATSMLIGWYVSGLVLRPIGRITSVARDIQATDLSRRIELGGPADELRDLGDTFDQMLDRLDQAFEDQRQFIQETSHELRNPLAVIRTNLDVVLNDPKANLEEFRFSGEVANRAAVRMSALVDDLLLLAHHERRDVDREPIFLSQVVSETIEDFSAFAKKNNVSLTLEMSSEIKVIGDAAALRRALANLLSNAIRITGSEKTGGQIKVVGGQDTDQVWVSVEDDGPGLSTEDIERVFQRFWKGNVSEAKESGRSGLGLAIVRQIVEGHGGQVTVRSQLGNGATFTIWLPRYITL